MKKTALAYSLYFMVILNSAQADILGEIEYLFPMPKEQWTFYEKKSENPYKMITHLYNRDSKDSSQIFIAMLIYNPIPEEYFSSITEEIFETLLQPHFQKGKISVSIIEKKSDSVLYEWKVKEQANELAHGWTRQFMTHTGMGQLDFGIYSISRIENINELKPIWIKTLREAKVIQNPSSK